METNNASGTGGPYLLIDDENQGVVGDLSKYYKLFPIVYSMADHTKQWLSINYSFENP